MAEHEVYKTGGSRWFATVVAGACALLVLGGVTLGSCGVSPARDVSFEGGWSGYSPSCHGPDLWTGKEAYTACDWAYDRRGLVRIDPEAARATVVYRWEVDDGNSPELRLVVPCGDEHLFVIAETNQATLVRQRGEAFTGSPVRRKGNEILGAACAGDDVELFAKDANDYVVLRKRGEALEPVRKISLQSRDERVVGAWRAEAGWHVVVGRVFGEGLRSGPVGGPYEEIEGGDDDTCLAGGPGGWLFVNGSKVCGWTESIVSEAEGRLRVESIPRTAEAKVLYEGRHPTAGYAQKARFGGMGKLDFRLLAGGGVFIAERQGQEAAVAKSAYSSLPIGARAYPLEGDRVAVLGGLGDMVVVLSPSLERLDGLGLQRIVRPIFRFQASANSVFDRICYVAILLLTAVWIAAAAVVVARKKTGEKRWRRTCWTYVGLFLVSAWSLWNILGWM